MSKKLKFFLIIVFVIFISILLSERARSLVLNLSTNVANSFLQAKDSVLNFVSEHFNQKDEIRDLRQKNKELERTAGLSIAFAGELNRLLKENGIKEYKPNMKLVRALTYKDIGDYNKVWVDFENFNASKIYGLVHQGFSAGIVAEKDGRPLIFLQNDPKSIFSVYIGDNKIKGVVFGAKNTVEAKYIPIWTKPNIGDEVFTSGLDGIFFEGIRVGKVVSIHEDNTFLTAIIEPFARVDVPGFFYIIMQE